MAELTLPRMDFTSLGQLPAIIKKSRNEQTLASLGQGLADGSMDYRQAAAQTAGMGDITHTLQFLALAEQQKKQGLEQAASADFSKGLGGMFGAQPSAAPPTSSPMPVPGAPARVPQAIAPLPMDRAPVASSAKVWGDDEAEAAGIYEPKPTRVASLASPTATDARPAGPAPTVMAPQVGAQHVPLLLQSLSNPNLPAGQKETAKVLLTHALGQMKPNERTQYLQQMKANPELLDIEMKLKAAGKTEVNVDQKGEGELSKTLGKGLGERINKIADEGDAARNDLALIGQLRDLGAVITTGAPAAIQGWLAERGIKVGENVGAVEAYSAILDKMTPGQRIPGSGASSDFDAKMFKGSLNKLIATPGGNEIISNTLAGLAQYKLDRAAIADRVQTGEVTAKDAIKEMRNLPNPYENFKNFAKTGFKADPGNPASATAPQQGQPMKFSQQEADQSLSNARAAIQANPAAKAAIIKKLRDNGLPTDGL